MLAIGQIVEVVVQHVAVFGLFCRHADEDVLLLIPETSWIASFCSCEQFAEIGDRLTVKIINVDNINKRIAASITSMHPNPWASGLLTIGSEYKARVVRYVEKADRCGNAPGYLLELLPGAYAMMRADEHTLEPNQFCTVVIVDSDISKHSVKIMLK